MVISPSRVLANSAWLHSISVTSPGCGSSGVPALPQLRSNTVPRIPMVAVLVWNFTCLGADLAIRPVATRSPPLINSNNMLPRAGCAGSKANCFNASCVPLLSVRRVSSRNASTAKPPEVVDTLSLAYRGAPWATSTWRASRSTVTAPCDCMTRAITGAVLLARVVRATGSASALQSPLHSRAV